jgi:hypothetical protein
LASGNTLPSASRLQTSGEPGSIFRAEVTCAFAEIGSKLTDTKANTRKHLSTMRVPERLRCDVALRIAAAYREAKGNFCVLFMA